MDKLFQAICTILDQHTQLIQLKCTILVHHAQLCHTFPPPQSSMHNSSPSAHQTRMSQSSPSAPPQGPTRSSNPVQASRSSFFQVYANQSNSNPIAPPNLRSSPTPRLRRKMMVTSETLNASKNAFGFMGAIKFAGSQSSMHGSKK